MAGRRARTARSTGRARSQHFLRSQSLAAAIVRESGVRPGDRVVEIGAGSGRLTAELARAGARLVAYELDPVWAARLARRWRNVDVVCGDALEASLPSEPFRVVANLPFHGTTPLVRRLLDPRMPLSRADVVVAWGFAVGRTSVWPTTALSVCWSAWHELTLVRRLPASAFAPRPSVDAAVVRVLRREEPLVAVEDASAFTRFVRTGFERGLRAVVPPRRLRSLADTIGFDSAATARELDAHQWAALWRRAAVRRVV